MIHASATAGKFHPEKFDSGEFGSTGRFYRIEETQSNWPSWCHRSRDSIQKFRSVMQTVSTVSCNVGLRFHALIVRFCDSDYNH